MSQGCLDKIDVWYRQQYVLFLGATLVVAVIEFCVLLSVIFSCTRLQQNEGRVKLATRHKPIVYTVAERSTDNIYMDNAQNANTMSPCDEIKEVYVQPPDLYRHKYNTTFKPAPSKYQYQISKSYLV